MFEFISARRDKRRIVDRLTTDIASESIGTTKVICDSISARHVGADVNLSGIDMEVMFFFLHCLNRLTIRVGKPSLQAALYDSVAVGAIVLLSRTLKEYWNKMGWGSSPEKTLGETIADELYAREIEYAKVPQLVGEDGIDDRDSVLQHAAMRIANHGGIPGDPLFQLEVEKVLLQSLDDLQLSTNVQAMEKLL